MRVLDGDDLRGRDVGAVGHADRLAKLFGRETAGLAPERSDHQPGVHRWAAELREQDVRVLFRDDLVARFAERLERDLVRHRRGRHEDGDLLSEKQRGQLLQPVDRRVLPLLLVPDLRGGDRGPHLRARLRLRI
jgi:hypothetical protein